MQLDSATSAMVSAKPAGSPNSSSPRSPLSADVPVTTGTRRPLRTVPSGGSMAVTCRWPATAEPNPVLPDRLRTQIAQPALRAVSRQFKMLRVEREPHQSLPCRSCDDNIAPSQRDTERPAVVEEAARRTPGRWYEPPPHHEVAVNLTRQPGIRVHVPQPGRPAATPRPPPRPGRSGG